VAKIIEDAAPGDLMKTMREKFRKIGPDEETSCCPRV
jgi:hypothetical protein